MLRRDFVKGLAALAGLELIDGLWRPIERARRIFPVVDVPWQRGPTITSLTLRNPFDFGGFVQVGFGGGGELYRVAGVSEVDQWGRASVLHLDRPLVQV